jgi:hypothetical protein
VNPSMFNPYALGLLLLGSWRAAQLIRMEEAEH